MQLLKAVLVMVIFPVTMVFASGGPVIKFDKEVHDYGRVLYGDQVTEEFKVFNDGTDVLRIDKLEASCGCTKVIKGSSEIPPKGETSVVATFETTGLRAGKKQKTIFVHSNDADRPVVKLTLYADVVRELSLEPPTFSLKLNSFQKEVKISVNLKNESKKDVTVLSVNTHPEAPKAILKSEKMVVPAGKSAPLEVLINLVQEPGRSHWMGKLNILTDHPTEKELDLRYLIKLD